MAASAEFFRNGALLLCSGECFQKSFCQALFIALHRILRPVYVYGARKFPVTLLMLMYSFGGSMIPQIGLVEQQARWKMEKKGYSVPTDPNWNQQWSLVRFQFV